MAEASLLHIAESLLVKLSPQAFKEIRSWWGMKDDLQKLKSSIKMIKAGLLDAEKRQHGRHPESELVREWLHRLKNVLYDADDLFDEVFTIEECKQTLEGKDKVVGEIRDFFSKSNPVVFRVQIARKIKKIRKELDDIKSDMGHFRFNLHLSEETMPKTIYERETGSVVAADEIIGREEEERELMGFLLDSASSKEGLLDIIPIVGFGGLGKTTLAQLLYNNEEVKANFELRAWACISDTDRTKEKAKIVLKALQAREYLYSFEGSQNPRNANEISLDELQLEIQARIQNKKYLLVLDDIWDEDPQRLIDLRDLLRGGKRGSKIVVTTRSWVVAKVIGSLSPCAIKGLADDKAWELFRRLAFKSAVGAENQNLIEMGKEIVRKCKNVPLAIKAVATLLYTYRGNERMWKSIMDSDLLTLEQSQDLKILPILKLSYDHLPSRLKHCFALFSIFRKDYKMKKAELVNYWIAQGYIGDSSDRGPLGLQEIGENYLEELTWRCFLQNDGKIYCYMHDLIHDLAQYVAGEEVSAFERHNCCSKDIRIRHLSFVRIQSGHDLSPWARARYLRSFISLGTCRRSRHNLQPLVVLEKKASLVKLALSFNFLRILDLKWLGLEQLPSSVGNLKHLRCLNICGNKFKHLPATITKLHNLKILDVASCTELEALPANFKMLINLMSLEVYGCNKVKGMPCGFGQMSSLESLDVFKVGENSTKFSKLEAVAELINLRGRLVIGYTCCGGGMRKVNDEKRVDLSSLAHLHGLVFWWDDDESDSKEDEFECSQPPMNLKILQISRFPGQKLPQWKSFNNLLDLFVENCRRCKNLPSFGRLPRIRKLVLAELHEMEYIQQEEDDFDTVIHFPCLKQLVLKDLRKLKAWSPGLEKWALQYISSSPLPCFHSLHSLTIQDCPKLMSMPLPRNKRCDLNIRNVEELKEPLQTLMRERLQSHHQRHHPRKVREHFYTLRL